MWLIHWHRCGHGRFPAASPSWFTGTCQASACLILAAIPLAKGSHITECCWWGRELDSVSSWEELQNQIAEDRDLYTGLGGIPPLIILVPLMQTSWAWYIVGRFMSPKYSKVTVWNQGDSLVSAVWYLPWGLQSFCGKEGYTVSGTGH